MENFIYSRYGERLHILNTENTKIVSIFFHICWISAKKLTFFISQGSVVTYLRQGCQIKILVHGQTKLILWPNAVAYGQISKHAKIRILQHNIIVYCALFTSIIYLFISFFGAILFI